MSTTPLWFPLALSWDVAPETAIGVRLHERELVVWRDPAGTPHVWEDRCPHRGMRLSLGFVRGDRLTCLYHGWQFDGGGRCRYIPAHPQLDVPATITVERFIAREHLGMIWTALPGVEPDGMSGAALDVLPVRTLSIDAAAPAVLAMLREAAFDNSESAFITDTLVRYGSVIVGIQPATATMTFLHVAVDRHQLQDRGKLCRSVQDLRARIEASQRIEIGAAA